MRLTLLSLLAALLTACAHDFALMKKDETLHGYRAAIRWSEFEKVQGFQSDMARRHSIVPPYNQVRVTSYNVLSQSSDKNSMVLRQRVEIRYYFATELSERSVIDEEVWRYDDEQEKWLLDSPLPRFK